MDIKVDGVVLVGAGNTGYTLNLVSPLGSYADVPGSKVYSIKVEDSPFSRQMFGNVQHPSIRRNAFRLYDIEMVRGNVMLERGYGVLRDAKAGFDLSITANYREVFGAYKDKSLQQIEDFGTLDFGTLLTNTPAVNGYVLPTISNPKFYENGNAPGGWNGKVNNWSGGAYTSGVKVPMFFVKNILNRLTALTGVTFSGTFYSSALMDKVLFYNMREANISTGIDIRKHLPNMTIGQMLLGIRKTFNVLLRIDSVSNKVRMDWADGMYSEVPTRNWSEKMARITKGSPSWSNGLRLRSVSDGGDGMSKDSFFLPFESPLMPGGGTELGYLDIESPFSGLMMDGALPAVEQVGITDVQSDKSFGNRLLYWLGGASPVASNAFAGVVLNNEEKLAAYFSGAEKFYKSSFRVEEKVWLTASDIADMARIFKGEVADAPVVHVWGSNWLVDNIVVPDGEDEACQVVMYRM
jgi:hypothetical protein